jgi:hypothetical protein
VASQRGRGGGAPCKARAGKPVQDGGGERPRTTVGRPSPLLSGDSPHYRGESPNTLWGEVPHPVGEGSALLSGDSPHYCREPLKTVVLRGSGASEAGVARPSARGRRPLWGETPAGRPSQTHRLRGFAFSFDFFLVLPYTATMLLSELGTPVETLRAKIYSAWRRL